MRTTHFQNHLGSELRVLPGGDGGGYSDGSDVGSNGVGGVHRDGGGDATAGYGNRCWRC